MDRETFRREVAARLRATVKRRKPRRKTARRQAPAAPKYPDVGITSQDPTTRPLPSPVEDGL